MHYDSENIPAPSGRLWLKLLGTSLSCLGLWIGLSDRSLALPANPPPAIAPGANINQIVLPPAEDVPEEILRTEIIFEARSPLDGEPLSPSEYAQLQTELAERQTTLTLNSDIRFYTILLQLRRGFKPIIPFLP